jgi:hypothetical protein
MITYFVVQSFSQGKKGRIVPDQAIQAQSAEHAQRMAARLSSSRIGVVAFSRTGDPDAGEYDEAVVLASYGYMPEEEGHIAIAS